MSFAAARQRALTGLLPEEDAALLESPNNILGIEYCKALLGQNAPLRPVTIRREGSAHDGALAPGHPPLGLRPPGAAAAGETEGGPVPAASGHGPRL